jgi:hypothetical protein
MDVKCALIASILTVLEMSELTVWSWMAWIKVRIGQKFKISSLFPYFQHCWSVV